MEITLATGRFRNIFVIFCAATFLAGCSHTRFINGIVKDSANRPISGATVEVRIKQAHQEAKTSADGEFQVGITAGSRNPEIILSVTKTGYHTFEGKVRAGEQPQPIVICPESKAQATVSINRPQRKVKNLPLYMTGFPQPIPDELKLPNAPPTARSVDCFLSFSSDTSMKDVVQKCGIPDEHQGRMSYVFLYDMSDGSLIVVGTPGLKSIAYVDHFEAIKPPSQLLRTAH